jgi:hypothetical protein
MRFEHDLRSEFAQSVEQQQLDRHLRQLRLSRSDLIGAVVLEWEVLEFKEGPPPSVLERDHLLVHCFNVFPANRTW